MNIILILVSILAIIGMVKHSAKRNKLIHGDKGYIETEAVTPEINSEAIKETIN